MSLSITEYDEKDLIDTAKSIAESLDNVLAENFKNFFKTLARTYKEYIQDCQNSIKENKDFHGNRDFYSLIKIAMRELIERRNDLKNENENSILNKVGLLSLSRNFGVLGNSNEKIKEIFQKNFYNFQKGHYPKIPQ